MFRSERVTTDVSIVAPYKTLRIGYKPHLVYTPNAQFEKGLCTVFWGLCLQTSCDLLMSNLIIWRVVYDHAAVQYSKDQNLWWWRASGLWGDSECRVRSWGVKSPSSPSFLLSLSPFSFFFFFFFYIFFLRMNSRALYYCKTLCQLSKRWEDMYMKHLL